MDEPVITSPANERIRAVRALHEKAGRRAASQYLIEGPRLLAAARAAGIAPALVVYEPATLARHEAGRRLLAELRRAGLPGLAVNERVMRAVAETVTPQGVAAVLPLPETAPLGPGPWLVLDGVQDPGNVGTALRAALAAGAGGVLLTPGCADPFAPKVVRAAMGAHFHLPIRADQSWASLAERLAPRQVWLAEPRGGERVDRVDWRQPSALVIGGEARGPSPEAVALATGAVTLPMAPGSESLNAAVAAAVILYEAFRQREYRDGPHPPAPAPHAGRGGDRAKRPISPASEG